MTDDEARKLATRCIDTWPTGPRAYVWRDFLVDLDAAAAAAAYRTLVADSERTPTPGQFHTAYRAARATARREDERTAGDGDTEEERAPDDGDTEEVIPLSEYLRRLRLRAEAGDAAAADELEVWRRHTTSSGRLWVFEAPP